MRKTYCLFNQFKKLFEVMQYATQYPKCGGTVRVIAAITEPALIARILEHRDGRDDFRGKVPAGGARAPPAVSWH